MRNHAKKIIVVACLCLFAGAAYAEMKYSADRAPEPKYDPKKKKPGEECQTSDECQIHHSCVKKNDKSVCTPPMHINIPNT